MTKHNWKTFGHDENSIMVWEKSDYPESMTLDEIIESVTEKSYEGFVSIYDDGNQIAEVNHGNVVRIDNEPTFGELFGW